MASGGNGGAERPNLILFFTDDQGHNDVGCFGSPDIKTPTFDRMAREGTRLTDFYAQTVCGPSRAGLMTGCYPIRVAEPGNRKHQHTVLHPREITLAETLKRAGYATGMVGKWHLAGRRRKAYPPELMPLGQGFDSFFGTPLHNGFTRTVEAKSFRTQLMRGGEVIDDFLDQGEMDTLTPPGTPRRPSASSATTRAARSSCPWLTTCRTYRSARARHSAAGRSAACTAT